MNPTCVRCGRPTPDGYADSRCADRAASQLSSIAELTPAARDVAHGQSRRGAMVVGNGDVRLELKPAAWAKLDAIENLLTTWARHIAEERGQPIGIDPVARRPMDPVVAFLRARIRESPGEVDEHATRIANLAYRTAAEAAEAVVAMTSPGPAWISPTADHRALAATFADHPDYDGSWA